MMPIWSPEAHALLARPALNGNDRIQEPPEFSDDGFKFANVRIRKISLIRSRFDQIDWQRRQEYPSSAVRFSIHRQCSPAMLINGVMQINDFSGRSGSLQFGGSQADRRTGGFSPSLHSTGRPDPLAFLLRHARSMVGESALKRKPPRSASH